MSQSNSTTSLPPPYQFGSSLSPLPPQFDTSSPPLPLQAGASLPPLSTQSDQMSHTYNSYQSVISQSTVHSQLNVPPLVCPSQSEASLLVGPNLPASSQRPCTSAGRVVGTCAVCRATSRSSRRQASCGSMETAMATPLALGHDSSF